MADTPENATEFTPSTHQQQVLEAFQTKDYRISVLKACSDAGIDRCQWYRWMDGCAGFSEWWQAKAEAFFARKLPSIYGALTDAAVVEDRHRMVNQSAAKILLDRFDKGFTPGTRVESTHRVTDIANMTVSEMLDAYAKKIIQGDTDQ